MSIAGGGEGGGGGVVGGGVGGGVVVCGGTSGGGDEEGNEVPLPLPSDRARPGNDNCGGGGMPTTAESTGSHCSGQAPPPRTEGRDLELGKPSACE